MYYSSIYPKLFIYDGQSFGRQLDRHEWKEEEEEAVAKVLRQQ